VLDNSSIMQSDLSPRAIGHLAGVRNQDARATIAMKRLEQRENLIACGTIQRAGRFGGQDESRIVHHRSSNDDALLFSSGDLIWPMVSGSPFNPDVTKTYAGNPGNPATNPNAVSQYDNACAQAALHQMP
jgi:hypothetical protein